MQSVKDILKKFDPLEDKYISREFQSYGVYLAQRLKDEKHTSMYIRFAKNHARAVLDQALRFVIDANARNRAALFMWKLKKMGVFEKDKILKAKKLKEKVKLPF